MLAYFSIIVEPNGSFTSCQGSLFRLPPELCDQFRVSKYTSINEDGWHVSEFGYLLYRKTDDFGRSYIIPGLHLLDGPKPTKKVYGYTAVNTKQMIEEYLKQHLLRSKQQRLLAEESTTALVHDLRHLSSAIYHSAEQAGRAHANRDHSELADSLKTIVATQTMLKARIDYLDYTTGVDRFEKLEKIPVYSRVDKVVRCFRAAANDKSINIKISGGSYRFTRGPNILDIVPYTLIDNAIKYSPPHNAVEVGVYDLEAKTVVSVTSIGPRIAESEVEKVFSVGFRGQTASKLRPAGTGIGLSVAKEIVEKFSGELSVEQTGEVVQREGTAYRTTTFTFSVPSSGEDTYRMNMARRKRRFVPS
ncbi:HAMP domain-containing histidine kinase [Tateyamaria omphalii]|uniref:sensor histidine kinase n=1 Tax=Tateyamaria omphalii TaxID=299262 RepID=UPI001C99341D|nr:HAMP domain-containing sensor histidine kinase [Tateyamaria omphalii]MBY5935180.1 HAMP domain-containing histidine kinase [Tateyamaria omphalii]